MALFFVLYTWSFLTSRQHVRCIWVSLVHAGSHRWPLKTTGVFGVLISASVMGPRLALIILAAGNPRCNRPSRRSTDPRTFPHDMLELLHAMHEQKFLMPLIEISRGTATLQHLSKELSCSGKTVRKAEQLTC